MKRKSWILAALVAVVNIGVLAAPAHAAGNTARCGPIPSQSYCYVEAYGFPGGTLAVDFDVYGPSFIPDNPLKWKVTGQGQWDHCVGTFRMSDPPQSWLCPGLNPGGVTLWIDKDPSAHAWAGVRWPA